MAIKYSNEFKESIVSLSQTGRSANSLAKEYNVSVSTVTKLIIAPIKVLFNWDYNDRLAYNTFYIIQKIILNHR